MNHPRRGNHGPATGRYAFASWIADRLHLDPHYRRLIGFALHYRGRLVLGGACSLLFAGSGLSALVAAQRLLRTTFADETASLRSVLGLTGVLIGWAFLFGFGKFLSEYNLKWVGLRIVTDLREKIFAHLQDLSVGYFSRSRSGELISRTIADTHALHDSVTTVLTDAVQQPLMLLALTGLVLYQDWRLALGGLLLMPLCSVPVIVFGRRVRRSARRGQERLADLTSVMQDALGGVQIIKAYGTEARECRRFEAHCRDYFRRCMKVIKARALNDPVVMTVSAFGTSLALVYAFVAQRRIDELMIFAGALIMLYDPVKKLGRIHLHIEQSSAAAERVFELLDTPPAVKNRPHARPFEGGLKRLCFDHVGFGYGEQPVFEDLCLELEAGRSLAVVGPSGVGKSTLINLLLRFFDVEAGRILINGADLRDLSMESWRACIGLVTQETFLFNETVASNIAYGCPGATTAEIESAARRAHAHDFIVAMPSGYDTPVGERGACLSGGQRQRLAIARAILRRPQLLILDEATSALDQASERLVQQAIETIMHECTSIAVAHRLTTIMNCDHIAVLGDGRVREFGTHETLLRTGGLYRQLYDLQFRTNGSGPAFAPAPSGHSSRCESGFE